MNQQINAQFMTNNDKLKRAKTMKGHRQIKLAQSKTFQYYFQ